MSVFNAGMHGAKGTAWLGGTRASSFWRWSGTILPALFERIGERLRMFPDGWRLVFGWIVFLANLSARAQTGLGLALAKLQQTDAAVAAMKEAIKLDAKQTAPRLQLAEYLFKVSRIDGAISEYRAVLEVDPDNRTARERLELICLKPDVPACAKTN